MLRYAVIFLIIALFAGYFGFFTVASAATGIALILFWVFLAVFLVAGLRAGLAVFRFAVVLAFTFA